MTKKVLVTKEWRDRAMDALSSVNECIALAEGLQTFLCTKLSPEQQKELEKLVLEYLDVLNEKGVDK